MNNFHQQIWPGQACFDQNRLSQPTLSSAIAEILRAAGHIKPGPREYNGSPVATTTIYQRIRDVFPGAQQLTSRAERIRGRRGRDHGRSMSNLCVRSLIVIFSLLAKIALIFGIWESWPNLVQTRQVYVGNARV